MRLTVWILLILAAWKWGDWRNWRKYEGAIYYTIVFSLIYTILCADYPMWKFEKDPSLPFLFNHSLVSIAFGFIVFPSVILVYLGRFPKKFWNGVAWTALFITILSGIEALMTWKGRQTFHNGWTMWTSVVFNCIMYPFIRLYQSMPLLTLLLSFLITIMLCIIFRVPIHQLP
ncbi:CBO0543 family protein [Anoxybacteroides tepidamans]|uniref:CBO0543 family protein n=1 Tax=Anoxybacteroides tepidamans TaxID=265948 RepID=UPI000686D8C8|nr:CBO0543 family protein [Anoxybacillus tepidamans]